MGRFILAVVVGFVVWSVMWVGGNQVIFGEAMKKAAASAVVLGVVLLAVGIVMQTMAWKLNPVWYHLSFLTLLVPVTVIGGMVVRGRRQA